VIRRDRHVSADQLASLEAGDLRPRKAARIETHAAGCDRCSQLRRQLASLPSILASAHYPPMPEKVSVGIEAAFRVEATQRLSAMPASEAGRRELPGAHRRRGTGQGWQLPRLSVTATRLVAAAGALAVVAASGYAIASHAGKGATSSPSAGSAAAPAQVQQMSAGPDVTYGRPGATHTIHSVQSSANFVPASLSTQATNAVHDAQARGASAAEPSLSAPGASRAQTSASAGSAAPPSGVASRLAGCIDLIAPGRTVLLVDLARFEGKAATIIVIAALAASPAQAWVVGSSCSASDKDIIAHAVLGHL
jgi:hypothetical protein